MTAQVCEYPAESAMAEGPLGNWTWLGENVHEESLVFPTPSWPAQFAPQHQTEPSSRMEQVCSPPVATAVAALPAGSDTAVGVDIP